MTGHDKSGAGTIEVPRGLLNLEYTLTNGQLFRWREREGGWWEAVTGGRLLRIRRMQGERGDEERFEFETLPGDPDADFVSRFFRSEVSLPELYESWAGADPYLRSLTERFRGLRLVRQEPEECLLSFICSTANFIPRIMKAIGIMARDWGEPIRAEDGSILTHAFPKAAVLAAVDPAELSASTGLEWRAANVVKVAKQLAARPAGWLDEVSRVDYATARGELQRIEGVGPKIADCVCLFAMAKDQAVPVDTHVWQLTRDRYLPALRGKTLTPTGYSQVVSYYQSHFEKAGWAQQYLFFDHLLDSREKRARRDT